MGLFDDLGKHLESFSQEVAKQAGPAVVEAWKHAGKLGQETGRHLAPAGTEAWNRMVEVSISGAEEANRCANLDTVSRSLTVLLPLHQMLSKM
jgi:hypothetical protein